MRNTETVGARDRVLLVYPPFGAASFPSIGLSILKGTLLREGIPCDIRYLNLEFIDRLPGVPRERMRLFEIISQRNELSLGDWVFAKPLYDREVSNRMDTSLHEFLASTGVGLDLVAGLRAARNAATEFVETVSLEIANGPYRVIGFHSIFSQTLACLAIAQRVKRATDSMTTLLGGPAVQGDMGIELLRQFEQIDFVVQGEAERTIVPIVRTLIEGGSIGSIPGVVSRKHESGTRVVCANPIDVVTDMDSVAAPDFDDYFNTLRDLSFADAIDVFVPIENARGCWWGAKHHCTFCGMVGQTMTFRSRSAPRALAEIRRIVERYNVRTLICVDSILDMRYFRTLLPAIAAADLNVLMFHEVKANLTRDQVRLLDEAGIRLLQPGLEHLSSEVLALMRKGTTYLQNVQLLKWACERDIIVFWSVLYGFPGERWEHYASLPAQMRALRHLFPPKALVRVRADRFSPLHETGNALGISRQYPARGYRYVYPFDDQALARLAYHFDYEYAEREPELNERIEASVGSAIAEWNVGYFRDRATLNMFVGERRLVIFDTRDGQPRYFVMEGATRDIYLACDSARSAKMLAEVAEKSVASPVPSFLGSILDPGELVISDVLEEADANELRIKCYPVLETSMQLASILSSLQEDLLVASENDRYLALACQVTESRPIRAPRSWAEKTDAMCNIAGTRRIRIEGVAEALEPLADELIV